MFDKFADVVINFIGYFRIATVVDQYEEGVLLRFGKFVKTLGPGLHFQIPLGIDAVHKDNVVPSTMNLGAQSLTTMDGQSVVVSGIVTWAIADIEAVLLKVEDANTVLNDTAYGTIAQAVAESDWDYIQSNEFDNYVTNKVRKECKKWGIKIQRVRFSDKTASPSIRLWQEQL